MRVVLPRLVFQLGEPSGGGGGGGGNRQRGPIRHAEAVGRDVATLRTATKPGSGDRFAADSEDARYAPALGLDQEAITAVRGWRFEPGRLGDRPVDVLVTVVMDFTIRGFRPLRRVISQKPLRIYLPTA
jgi:hypothetical protein